MPTSGSSRAQALSATAALAIGVASVVAQDAPPVDRGAERAKEMGARPREGDPIGRSGAIPGLENAAQSIQPPSLVAEGTFLPVREATLVRAATGNWVAVFDPDAEGRRLPSMVVLPCPALEEIEPEDDPQSPAGPRLRVRLSGQVFAYANRNVLLLTSAVVQSDATRSEALDRPPSPASAEARAADAPDPSVADIIAELESDRDSVRSVTATARPRAQESDQGVRGGYISRRAARVVRKANAWTAVFDNDPADAAPPAPGQPAPPSLDQPLVLLPNQAMGRIEALAAQHGDALLFQFSGRVIPYRGRGFLLVTMFQIARKGELGPAQ